ncbi:MAG: succinylglutamate desuccinylase/aspartoacylase family protein, partial [Pseudomonadota bacterium]
MAIDFEFSRFEIPLKELPSGETLQLNVFRMVSAIPGPFVHIQANIHGAEIQGNAVIYQLMSYFKNHPFRGTLQFIPQCNPMALNHKEGTHTLGRFSPVTGDNWNRNYADLSHKSFEEIAFDFKTFTQSHTSASWDHIKKDFKHHLQMAAEKIIQNTMPYRLADHKLLALKLQSLAAPADIVLDLHTGPVATRYLYAAEY